MNLSVRAFYRVPLIGWLTKDAVQGASDTKYYFFINITLLYAALVYLIGYPFLIVSVLTATALMLCGIVILTASDLIENAIRARRDAGKTREV
jgi:hypothetical protein